MVLLTLLPLGLRAAGVVMISIPLSLAMGLAGLYARIGYSLNQLSIAGFVVALGLLVDDSIVVVENIARFLRMGYSRERAAIEGVKQIFVAIIGCTGTCCWPSCRCWRCRHRRPVHPRAADGGGADDDRLADRGADDHPLPRQPHAAAA
jgi:hypothetical protein